MSLFKGSVLVACIMFYIDVLLYSTSHFLPFPGTMSLNRVILESDVYLVCLTHALSTEREEVMGLLIGEVS